MTFENGKGGIVRALVVAEASAGNIQIPRRAIRLEEDVRHMGRR